MSRDESGERELLETVDRLILDVKAPVLLSRSEAKLRSLVSEKLIRAADDDVRGFIQLVVSEGTSNRPGTLRMLGELLLSAMFIVTGIVLLAPVAIGGPASLRGYFEGAGPSGLLGGLIGHIYAPITVVLGLLLVAGALIILRDAAEAARRRGLAS